MNKNLTELVFVLDRSGSMSSMVKEAMGGFNVFLEEQKKVEGEAKLTVVLFDHEYTLLCNGKNIKEVEPLTDSTYSPRGTTALLDAVGRVVDDIGKRLAATPEEQRPGKVLIAILTDGQENASKDYKKHKIHEMIKHQTSKYAWEFLFLAANQDAFAEAQLLGISFQNTSNYVNSSRGVMDAFDAISCSTSAYRSTGVMDNLADVLNKKQNKQDTDTGTRTK